MSYNVCTATGCKAGTAVAQWLRCCATNRKVAGLIPAGVTGFFIDIKSFRSHYGPGVDSAADAFPRRKDGRCLRLTTLPPSCAVVVKSGTLNFPEPSEPLQACNRNALPFTGCKASCMYLRQLLFVIVSSAAFRPTSYFVSLYFVNAYKRNLAFIRFSLNFFDNELAMHLSSNLKDILLK